MKKLKKLYFFLFVFLMFILAFSGRVEAKSKSFVRKIQGRKTLTLKVNQTKRYKYKVFVYGKASKQVTVKVKNRKINVRKKKNYLIVSGNRAGRSQITLISKGKNRKNKKIKKVIQVVVEETEEVISEKVSRSWVVTSYTCGTGLQGMFYTIEDEESHLIIIDGGWTTDEEKVRKAIQEHGNHVYAWILTHPHPDHVGAFNRIMNNPGDITVEHFYVTDVNYERYEETASPTDDYGCCKTYRKILKKLDNVHVVGEGDECYLLGLRVSFLHGWDSKVDSMSSDLCNAGALMFQVYGEEENMLFCSDVEDSYTGIIEDDIIKNHKEELEADYLQASHHGNWGLSTKFYDLIHPKLVFFDGTDALLDNQIVGYDSIIYWNYFMNRNIAVCNYQDAYNQIVLH